MPVLGSVYMARINDMDTALMLVGFARAQFSLYCSYLGDTGG